MARPGSCDHLWYQECHQLFLYHLDQEWERGRCPEENKGIDAKKEEMGNKQVKATNIQHSYKSEVLKFYFINFNICRVYRLEFMELIKSYFQTGRDGTDYLLTQVL